jgi:hypothetical protein
MKYTDYYKHLNESLVDKKIITVPDEAGTKPIPSNHLRLYHYTHADPEEIKRDGLKLSKAKGDTYGEPNFVWASLKKPNESKTYVEFSVPIDDPRFSMWGSKPDAYRGADFYKGRSNDFTFQGDIKPEEFIAIHEPWHFHYRYMTQDAESIETTLKGEHDWILDQRDRFPNEAKAVDAIKTNYGN